MKPIPNINTVLKHVYRIILAFFLFQPLIFGQNVAINTTGAVAHSSAGLDIDYSNRGLLIPRIALVATNNTSPVTTPATSLFVYNTASINDVTPGYYYWDGTQWVRFSTGGGTGWLITGNSGTNSTVNFIGTVDNVDWVIKTNNVERVRVGANGNIGIKTVVNNYLGVSNLYTSTALENTIIGVNAAIRNDFSTSITNNAVCAGSYNTVNVPTNFQNLGGLFTGMLAGSYNSASTNSNGGTNVGLYGKVCGSFNYSEVISNNALGFNVGNYNYSYTALTQPVNATTIGTNNYSIVNSPNNGEIYGIQNLGIANGTNNNGGNVYGIRNYSMSNGLNLAGGNLYGFNSSTQSNGNNNGTIYGIYNLTGSNGANTGTGLRYGIYNTWTENGATPSAGNTYGIYSTNGALAGSTNTVYGIYSEATGGAINYAGYFQGNVMINGNFTATGVKAFTIDHPLDPENKYLKHFCLESNEVLNHYSGTITTDENGLAIVQLPDYFEAINIDFRYQLTVIGSFAQVIIKEEIKNNQFTIQSDIPNIKVCWQVEAKRNDQNIILNPATDVVDKLTNEKGKYLQPELFNQNSDKGIHFVDDEKIKKENAAKEMNYLEFMKELNKY